MPADILIVDDERSINGALKKAMELAGYSVAVADSGVTAIKCCESLAPFKVALVDLMLPDMSGSEFISWCKLRYPDTIIFAMSALMDAHTSKALANLGVKHVLSKPFDDIFEIPKIVQRALQHEEARRGKDQN